MKVFISTIPFPWGQAAIYRAMIEGLAGVVEKDHLFKKVELSPRWLAAGKDSAIMNIEYASSGVSLKYRYIHDASQKKIILTVHGDVQNGSANLLLPASTTGKRALVNGKKAPYTTTEVNKSTYVVIHGWSGQDVEMVVFYE